MKLFKFASIIAFQTLAACGGGNESNTENVVMPALSVVTPAFRVNPENSAAPAEPVDITKQDASHTSPTPIITPTRSNTPTPITPQGFKSEKSLILKTKQEDLASPAFSMRLDTTLPTAPFNDQPIESTSDMVKQSSISNLGLSSVSITTLMTPPSSEPDQTRAFMDEQENATSLDSAASSSSASTTSTPTSPTTPISEQSESSPTFLAKQLNIEPLTHSHNLSGTNTPPTPTQPIELSQVSEKNDLYQHSTLFHSDESIETKPSNLSLEHPTTDKVESETKWVEDFVELLKIHPILGQTRVSSLKKAINDAENEQKITAGTSKFLSQLLVLPKRPVFSEPASEFEEYWSCVYSLPEKISETLRSEEVPQNIDINPAIYRVIRDSYRADDEADDEADDKAGDKADDNLEEFSTNDEKLKTSELKWVNKSLRGVISLEKVLNSCDLYGMVEIVSNAHKKKVIGQDLHNFLFLFFEELQGCVKIAREKHACAALKKQPPMLTPEIHEALNALGREDFENVISQFQEGQEQ